MAIYIPPRRDTGSSSPSLTGNYVTVDTDQTITADKIFEGTVTFNGTVLENLTIEDNTIIINSGEIAAGVSDGSAGLQVDRGTATDAKLLFTENSLGDDTDNRWVVDIGDGSQEQIVYDTMPDDVVFNGKLTVNNDLDVNFDLTVTSLAGNTDEIVTLDANGKLQNSGTTVAGLSGTYVLKSGDTMTGQLTLSESNILIQNTGSPSSIYAERVDGVMGALGAGDSISLWYDGTSSLWRVMGTHN